MPAKDRHPEITEALTNAVERLDLNGVIYKLAEIAVAKRDAADVEGGNKAEARYWQKALTLLHDFAETLEGIE